MTDTQRDAWRVSLHGGHSGEFCDHAEDTLEQLIEAAIAAGYSTFGITEHAPRLAPEFLYPEEREKGRSVASLAKTFGEYAAKSQSLVEEYGDQIHLLRGFETEVVPESRYVEFMKRYRTHFGFDYIVGSVHHVAGECIDGPEEWFAPAVEKCGGVEALARRYYEKVAEMIGLLRPEVVGHIDLISKNAPAEVLDTAAVHDAARAALEAVRDTEAILDVNTAGLRKGLGHPYPAPWVIDAARDMGIPFCFGDDSHRISEVGAGIDEARDYLLAHGVENITVLRRESDGIGREVVSLS